MSTSKIEQQFRKIDSAAIDFYIRALGDIATVLERHREVRTAFAPDFLVRVMRDGFLQTITESDQERILHESRSGEEFLLWKGPVRGEKMNWNCISWIFPFYTEQEIETAYELITRSEIDQQSWAAIRQFILSCRIRWQEMPFEVPANIIKVRVMGDDCVEAMQTLEAYPPNLRYVAKNLVDHLPVSNYLRQRIHVQVIVGEKFEPYIYTSKGTKRIKR